MLPTFTVRVTSQALTDLESIYAYIAVDSVKNAAAVMERLLDAIDTLAMVPHRKVIERQSSKLKHSLRSMSVKPYVIYFGVIDEERIVVIRHIRHGSRDQPDENESNLL